MTSFQPYLYVISTSLRRVCYVYSTSCRCYFKCLFDVISTSFRVICQNSSRPIRRWAKGLDKFRNVSTEYCHGASSKIDPKISDLNFFQNCHVLKWNTKMISMVSYDDFVHYLVSIESKGRVKNYMFIVQCDYWLLLNIFIPLYFLSKF